MFCTNTNFLIYECETRTKVNFLGGILKEKHIPGKTCDFTRAKESRVHVNITRLVILWAVEGLVIQSEQGAFRGTGLVSDCT